MGVNLLAIAGIVRWALRENARNPILRSSPDAIGCTFEQEDARLIDVLPSGASSSSGSLDRTSSSRLSRVVQQEKNAPMSMCTVDSMEYYILHVYIVLNISIKTNKSLYRGTTQHNNKCQKIFGVEAQKKQTTREN
eukprot:GEMP01074881.1.p1 GENE.GEMP01074881.1~~GEMP01074881.1.p1  ORF type:complete len:136 (-),score=7.12 GEMP01074881.1:11-418(-)